MRFGSRLRVDLSILKKNFEHLKLLCPENKVLFMIKADAYGHGMAQIVKYCIDEKLTDEFGCATLGEALEIRSAITDINFELYVFSETGLYNPEYHYHYVNKNIMPVISSLEDLIFFLKSEQLNFFPLNLKFNTGMNRLGIEIEQLAEVLGLLKKHQRKTIHHLMSHFACASQSVHKVQGNSRQYNNFLALKKGLREHGIEVEKSSMANSGAIEQAFALDETHIRPGLLLYGPSSLVPSLRAKGAWPGQLISSLETSILKTSKIKKGTPLGYGAMPSPLDGELLVLSLGYGDGFSTRYQGVELEGPDLCGRIVGAISMDMFYFLREMSKKNYLVGDRVVLWGKEQRAFLRFCDRGKTIPYEVLCALGTRIPRTYTL